jgi:hypothetical protein
MAKKYIDPGGGKELRGIEEHMKGLILLSAEDSKTDCALQLSSDQSGKCICRSDPEG